MPVVGNGRKGNKAGAGHIYGAPQGRLKRAGAAIKRGPRPD